MRDTSEEKSGRASHPYRLATLPCLETPLLTPPCVLKYMIPAVTAVFKEGSIANKIVPIIKRPDPLLPIL